MIKIALIQMNCRLHDVSGNLKKAEKYTQEAVSNGADLICLPEYFDSGYCCEKTKEILAYTTTLCDNNSISVISGLAKKYSVHIIAPVAVKVSEECYENTAVLIDDSGKIIGTYAKTHPVAEERLLLHKGKDYPVFETAIGKIGMLICYDLAFPEAMAILVEKGAEIVIVPSAWRSGLNLGESWDANIVCRALDNVVFLAAVNRIGDAGHDRRFLGHSAVVNPWGYIISGDLDDSEKVIYASIDLGLIKEVRNINPVLDDRNLEDFYYITTLVANSKKKI